MISIGSLRVSARLLASASDPNIRMQNTVKPGAPTFSQTQRTLWWGWYFQNGHHERSGSATTNWNSRPNPTPKRGSERIVSRTLIASRVAVVVRGGVALVRRRERADGAGRLAEDAGVVPEDRQVDRRGEQARHQDQHDRLAVPDQPGQRDQHEGDGQRDRAGPALGHQQREHRDRRDQDGADPHPLRAAHHHPDQRLEDRASARKITTSWPKANSCGTSSTPVRIRKT